MKPPWDSYFLTMCFLAAQRSIDQSTKHGCVAVDDENTLLGIGYNGPIRGSDDTKVPQERPAKYAYFIHSEENLIIASAKNGVSLKNSTFYVTGHPCTTCFRMIKQVGAKRIVYGMVGSACVDENAKKIINEMNFQHPIQIDYITKERDGVITLLNQTIEYYNKKA